MSRSRQWHEAFPVRCYYWETEHYKHWRIKLCDKHSMYSCMVTHLRSRTLKQRNTFWTWANKASIQKQPVPISVVVVFSRRKQEYVKASMYALYKCTARTYSLQSTVVFQTWSCQHGSGLGNERFVADLADFEVYNIMFTGLPHTGLQVTWCFAPSPPVRLYQGEGREERTAYHHTLSAGCICH